MRTIARTLGALIVVSACLTAAGAHAQDAEALLRQGVAARRAGNDEAALELFTRANAASPSGVARAQMGLAAQALGRWVQAYEDLQAALATSDEFVVRNRATLQGAFATVQTHVGRLELRSSVEGGRVEINGREVGTLPLPGPITVSIGETQIVVRQDGYHRFSRTVDVAGGVVSREEVLLVAIEAEPTPTDTTPQDTGAPPPDPVQPAEPTQPTQPTPVTPPAQAAPNRFGTPVPRAAEGGGGSGALLGLGIAASAIAATTIGLGIAYVDAFSQMSSDYDSAACQQGPEPERVCPDTLAARDLNQTGMIVTFVAGGTSTALAILFYALYGASGSGDGDTVACGAGPGELGVGCTATF